MRDVLFSPVGFAAMTFAVYAGALSLYRRVRLFFLHPVLVAVTALILLLRAGGIRYEEYRRGGDYITVLLAPAVVALGVPLYKEFAKVRKEAGALVLTTLFGSLTGIVSAVVPAVLAGAPREVIVSLAPKSVTSPIAMEIAGRLGGLPPLSAALVIFTGILGAVVGPSLLRLLHITEASAFGLALGFSSHGIGTARAFELGEEEGAFSSLGLCLNGLATSILTPLVLGVLL